MCWVFVSNVPDKETSTIVYQRCTRSQPGTTTCGSLVWDQSRAGKVLESVPLDEALLRTESNMPLLHSLVNFRFAEAINSSHMHKSRVEEIRNENDRWQIWLRDNYTENSAQAESLSNREEVELLVHLLITLECQLAILTDLSPEAMAPESQVSIALGLDDDNESELSFEEETNDNIFLPDGFTSEDPRIQSIVRSPKVQIHQLHPSLDEPLDQEGRSANAQSSPSPYNRNPPSPAYCTTRSDTNIPRSSPSPSEEEPPANMDHWICDACMGSISADEFRAHCIVCTNYDLCIDCYKMDRTSQTHQAGHKMRLILRTKIIRHDDLCFPANAVNPEISLEDNKLNWTIDENYIRWDHLGKRDSHVRCLATNVEPGHYRPDLVLYLQLSKHLNASMKAKAGETAIGKLRVIIGFPMSKSVFLHQSFPENENMENQLFTAQASTEFNLLLANEGPINVDLGRTRITIDQPKTELGILLQWTEMRGFEWLDDPIAQIAVEELR